MPPKPTATQRRSAARTICRTLGDELSVVAKPLAKISRRRYIMVRRKGGGHKRLYEGSRYHTGKKWKQLRL